MSYKMCGILYIFIKMFLANLQLNKSIFSKCNIVLLKLTKQLFVCLFEATLDHKGFSRRIIHRKMSDLKSCIQNNFSLHIFNCTTQHQPFPVTHASCVRMSFYSCFIIF